MLFYFIFNKRSKENNKEGQLKVNRNINYCPQGGTNLL